MDNLNENILLSRYEECDSKGHLDPKPDENYCNHCFRRLVYECIIEPDETRSDLVGIRAGIITHKKRQDFLRGLEALGERMGRL